MARAENYARQTASGAALRIAGPFRRLLPRRRERGREAVRGALKIELGRRFGFSASHRLHTPRLSEEENCRVFGKCNNPYGHGHNYLLEVCVSGEINPATGMIANLSDLDSFVEREIIEAFDHKSLN